MHDACICGRSENNNKCVVHDDLGWKNRTTRYFLPRHWLYEWFSQFHRCGTYLVLSRSSSIVRHTLSASEVLKPANRDESLTHEDRWWWWWVSDCGLQCDVLNCLCMFTYCLLADVRYSISLSVLTAIFQVDLCSLVPECLTDLMPLVLPDQQCQSTEGKTSVTMSL